MGNNTKIMRKNTKMMGNNTKIIGNNTNILRNNAKIIIYIFDVTNEGIIMLEGKMYIYVGSENDFGKIH